MALMRSGRRGMVGVSMGSRRESESATRRVLSGGIWNALSEVLPMLTAMALSVAAARALGADQLGRQSVIAFTEAALTSLLVTSMTDATIRTLAAQLGAGDVLGAAAVRRWSMAAHAISAVVVALVLVGVGAASGADQAAWCIVAVSTLLAAGCWAVTAQIVPERGWQPIAVRRLFALLVAPLLGIPAVLAGLGIPGIFAANAVASAGLLLSLRRVRPHVGSAGWGPPPRRLLQLWAAFALYEVVTQIVARRIEFIFLARYSSAHEVAMYSIPFMVVTAASAAPLAVAAASMPAVASAVGRGDLDRASERFTWALRMASLVALPMTAAIIGLGPTAVTAVYGGEFSRAADLVPWAALGVVLAPAGQLCISYWVGLGRLRPLIVAGLIGGAIDLGLALALIPGHGAAGAVVANLAGQSVAAVLLLAATLQALRPVDLRLGRWTATATASSVGALVLLGTQTVVPGIPGGVLGAALGAAAILLLGHVVGLIGPDDAAQLKVALPAARRLVDLVTCRPPRRPRAGGAPTRS